MTYTNIFVTCITVVVIFHREDCTLLAYQVEDAKEVQTIIFLIA